MGISISNAILILSVLGCDTNTSIQEECRRVQAGILGWILPIKKKYSNESTVKESLKLEH
jgi:hypothetical protein